VCVLSAAEIGNFYYGPGHPMKPHRKPPPALSCRLFLHRSLWILRVQSSSIHVGSLRVCPDLTVAAPTVRENGRFRTFTPRSPRIASRPRSALPSPPNSLSVVACKPTPVKAISLQERPPQCCCPTVRARHEARCPPRVLMLDICAHIHRLPIPTRLRVSGTHTTNPHSGRSQRQSAT